VKTIKKILGETSSKKFGKNSQKFDRTIRIKSRTTNLFADMRFIVYNRVKHLNDDE
jgi:hypothetical protein